MYEDDTEDNTTFLNPVQSDSTVNLTTWNVMFLISKLLVSSFKLLFNVIKVLEFISMLSNIYLYMQVHAINSSIMFIS